MTPIMQDLYHNIMSAPHMIAWAVAEYAPGNEGEAHPNQLTWFHTPEEAERHVNELAAEGWSCQILATPLPTV